MNIRYTRLHGGNFNERSLDGFIRHQKVEECWRCVDGEWRLLPIAFVEDWDISQCRKTAADIARHMDADQSAFGAFSGDRLVGFATVSHRIFGQTARYVELVCLQVSEDYRNQGIGRKLFECACEEARLLGAEKLYISSHSSRESQAAYKAFGCDLATEIDEALAAAEPCDVQLEFIL